MPAPVYTSWSEYTGKYKKSSTPFGGVLNAFTAGVRWLSTSFTSWETLQSGFIDSTYKQITDDTIAKRLNELSEFDEIKRTETLIKEFMFPQVIRDFHIQAAIAQETKDLSEASQLEDERSHLIRVCSIQVKSQIIRLICSEQTFFQAMLNIHKSFNANLIDASLRNEMEKLHEKAGEHALIKDSEIIIQNKSNPTNQSTVLNAKFDFNWRMLAFIIICILGFGLPLLFLISNRFRSWVTRVDENYHIDEQSQNEDVSTDDNDSSPLASKALQSSSNRDESNNTSQVTSGITFFSNEPTQKVKVDVLEQVLCSLLIDSGISNNPPEYSAHLIALYAKRHMQYANATGDVLIQKRKGGKIHLSIHMDEPTKYLALMHKTGKIGAPEIEVLTRNSNENFTLTIDCKADQVDLNRSFRSSDTSVRTVNRMCCFEFEPGSKVKKPFGDENKQDINRFIKDINEKIPSLLRGVVQANQKIRDALCAAPKSTDITEESFFEEHKKLKLCITAAKLMYHDREMTDKEREAYILNMESGYSWLGWLREQNLLPVDLNTMITPMEYTNTVNVNGAPLLTQVLMMGDHLNDQDWQYKNGEAKKKRSESDLNTRKGQASCPADLDEGLKEKALSMQVNFSRTIGTNGIITRFDLPSYRESNPSRLHG